MKTNNNTNLIVWDDSLILNIEEIDQQHQTLVDAINLLWKNLIENQEDDEISDHILGFLKDYVGEHFSAEEILMETEGYPNLNKHCAAHREFEQKIKQAIEQHNEGKRIGEELLNFLNKWLTDHIKGADRHYAKYVINRRNRGVFKKIITLFRKTDRKKHSTYSYSSKKFMLRGLDMNQAIATHIAWKKRLEDMIDGSSKESLNPDDIARHDLCVLGNWLKVNGEQGLSGTSEFEELHKSHVEFHKHAADVVISHQENKTDQAITLLQGTLRHDSNKVRFHIIRLCNKLNRQSS